MEFGLENFAAHLPQDLNLGMAQQTQAFLRLTLATALPNLKP